MSICGSKTHRLRTSRLGSVVTSEWIRLSDGQIETDAAVLAQLQLQVDNPDCAAYVTQRTPFCITDPVTEVRSPKYLLDWSDGTTTTADPVDDEDNWCECEC